MLYIIGTIDIYLKSFLVSIRRKASSGRDSWCPTIELLEILNIPFGTVITMVPVKLQRWILLVILPGP